MKTELHKILERGRFSPTTRTKYASVIDMWIAFAGTDPKNWTRLKTQAFYDDLCSRIKVKSANVYIASLRYVSKWYARLNDNPSLDFVQIQLSEPSNDEKTKTRHALTDGQAMALVSSCKQLTAIDCRDLALIVIGLETGMRRKSLAGSHFDKLNERSGYPAIEVPIKGRAGDAVYNVPLSDVALRSLVPWQSWLATKRSSTAKGPIFKRLFAGETRKRRKIYDVSEIGISEVMIHKVIAGRAAQAGIRHVHPHLLRHTFVTWRELAGLEPIQIASITGHKGPVDGFSGLTSYIDMAQIGGEVRNTTPAWLRDLVEEITVGTERT